tara:strand:+ start:3685 stop:5601 length:1917 start_codon:yes stop_codon:yes gene_type:complete
MAITKEYNLRISTKQAQENIDELNKSLKAQENLIDTIEKDLKKYEQQLKSTGTKQISRRKKLNEQIKETKKRLTEEKKGLQDVNKDRKTANKQLEEAKKRTADYGGVLGILDKQTGGVISGIGGLTKSVGGATKGFKLMRIAIMATGLGALVLAVVSVTQAFTRSEEGQEKWQRGMAVVTAVTNQILDLFASLGETILEIPTKITDAFGDPVGTLKSFGKSLLKFVKDPFGTVAEVITDAKDAVVGFVKETKEEIVVLVDITKARQKAHHIERDLIEERAEANRKINKIRLDAEDREKFNAAQRMALLKEAQRIEEEITDKEIKHKTILVKALEREMELGLNTIETKDKLAKLQAELINLDTKKFRSQRLLQTQITTAFNEEKANKQELLDDEVARLKDIETLKNTIRDAEAVKEDELRELELIKVQEHYNNLIDLATLNGLATSDLEQSLADKIKEIRNKAGSDINKNQIYWEKLTQREKTAILAQGLNNLATILGKESAAGKAAAIAATTISTFQSAQDSYKSLAGIPIIGPALGFAAATAAGIAGLMNVKKIIATKQPTIGGISVPSSGGGSLPSLPSPPTPSPPSFTSVGSSGTNQLADAIGQQNQQPVQAYVVSNDITNAQSLERNIIEGAAI